MFVHNLCDATHCCLFIYSVQRILVVFFCVYIALFYTKVSVCVFFPSLLTSIRNLATFRRLSIDVSCKHTFGRWVFFLVLVIRPRSEQINTSELDGLVAFPVARVYSFEYGERSTAGVLWLETECCRETGVGRNGDKRVDKCFKSYTTTINDGNIWQTSEYTVRYPHAYAKRRAKYYRHTMCFNFIVASVCLPNVAC